VAIAASWQTVASVTTTAGTVFTTASGYIRDLVVNNSGANTIFVGLGTASVATSVASFSIPAGGTIVLTECEIPTSAPLTAITGTGSSTISVGYGSLVNFT
jgi:hypothetical protein